MRPTRFATVSIPRAAEPSGPSPAQLWCPGRQCVRRPSAPTAASCRVRSTTSKLSPLADQARRSNERGSVTPSIGCRGRSSGLRRVCCHRNPLTARRVHRRSSIRPRRYTPRSRPPWGRAGPAGSPRTRPLGRSVLGTAAGCDGTTDTVRCRALDPKPPLAGRDWEIERHATVVGVVPEDVGILQGISAFVAERCNDRPVHRCPFRPAGFADLTRARHRRRARVADRPTLGAHREPVSSGQRLGASEALAADAVAGPVARFGITRLSQT